MKKKVSVIGAGVAGLASACRLQCAGYEVTLYEKESMAGGKMHRIQQDGYQFDLGPTIVMMPELYREVFEMCGVDPDDYIPMQRLDPMYSVFFEGERDKHYEISSDLIKLTKTLEQFGEEDTQGFFKYIQEIYSRFVVAKEHFLQKPFRKPSDFYNLSVLRQGLKLKTFDNADTFISKYIKNERLKQMISFQTLYIGVSPYSGPSLYTMIPMIEFLYGVWFIKGGMYTLAQSLERLFLEQGGTVHYNSPVDEIVIEGGKAIGIQVNGEFIASDFVMCNADFPYAMKNLVAEPKAKGKYTDKKIDNMKYSCSCFLMYLGMDKKYEEVPNAHNFIFNEELERNLNDIFSGKRLDTASFYVYIGSKLDPSLAPEGKDGLYVLVPVSDKSVSQYEWNDETIKHYRNNILNALEKIKGFENVKQEIVSESYMTPPDFERRFNAYNGATFGLQPTLAQSNHMRPQSKATHCENLYFTGSSTHPGAGVPIVLLSARIATEELLHDDKGILFHTR
ncbi:phytoene desaturase family protein [Planococcus sp. N028]|uniref:Phytoene desaturase family protein n=1 Tax=Planococcus shixiaomingii TaxID=3058393 RepID=A0ABT8N4K9_9BACL|nr:MULTISPECIES: phytoene desaturase family protein [unclassified Planococcus (in: firmicutes)]MDN7242830.1 phytoene desaturase family protein [Planococcus sp. N028]WKA55546.1 phytoene desaturase family protein [Planococcus sp. N022]